MFNRIFSRIPLNKNLYAKTLGVILILVVFGFSLAILAFDYELTKADPLGASISAVLLAYLVHLSLWNPDKE